MTLALLMRGSLRCIEKLSRNKNTWKSQPGVRRKGSNATTRQWERVVIMSILTDKLICTGLSTSKTSSTDTALQVHHMDRESACVRREGSPLLLFANAESWERPKWTMEWVSPELVAAEKAVVGPNCVDARKELSCRELWHAVHMWMLAVQIEEIAGKVNEKKHGMQG